MRRSISRADRNRRNRRAALPAGSTAEQWRNDMQYLLMIYANEAERPDPATLSALSAEYGTFTRDIIKTGHFKGGERLQPSSSATMVRVRDGKALMTDGPFAE